MASVGYIGVIWNSSAPCFFEIPRTPTSRTRRACQKTRMDTLINRQLSVAMASFSFLPIYPCRVLVHILRFRCVALNIRARGLLPRLLSLHYSLWIAASLRCVVDLNDISFLFWSFASLYLKTFQSQISSIQCLHPMAKKLQQNLGRRAPTRTIR